MAPKFLIKISPDSPQKIYFPGQLVTGKVCINLDKEVKIEELQFKLFGQAKVNFTKLRTIDCCCSRKIYLYHKTFYYGAKDEFLKYEFHIGITDGVKLPVGIHEYPFSFKIPLGLPSSYSGTHGQLNYSLCLDAILEENKTIQTEKHVIVPIIMNGDLDLKNEPADVKLPIEISIIKKTSLGFCKSGPISFKLTIPKKGFIPGESIPFLVEINNCSRKTVNSMEIALVQKIKYHAKYLYKYYTGERIRKFVKKTLRFSQVIVQQIGPGVAKGDSESWDSGNSFKIPTAIPPTKLAGCKIIDVQYTLHFEAIFDLTKKISKVIPIIIGAIPLAPPSYEEASLDKNANTLHGNGDELTAPAGQI